MDDYDYLLKYPFSKASMEYIDSKGLLLSDISSVVLEKTDLLFSRLFEPESYTSFFSIDSLKISDRKAELDTELLVYPVSKIILSILNNVPLSQAFASYHQKRFVYFIGLDYKARAYDSIERLIKDICPSVTQDRSGFFIPLASLLALELGEEYKLQYTNLEHGNIYFQNKEQLVEFLSIVLKKRILRTTEVSRKELPKSLVSFSEVIRKKYVSTRLPAVTYVIARPKDTEFPPCFDKLYNDMLSGHKLSHIGNYHLAVFLSNIGYSYQEILDIYRNLPNFDERISSYQIRNIMEKKYSVANCETLRSNGLCIMDCKVKHPLQLLRKKESVLKPSKDK